MKIARIFDKEGRFYVCDDAAPGLTASGGGFASKAEAIREAIRQGYTHGKGSGTYHGNEISRLSAPFNFRKVNAVKRESRKWRLF